MRITPGAQTRDGRDGGRSDRTGHLWGQAILLPLIAPSVTEDERIVSWFRKLERMSATPSMAAGLMRRMMEIDLRPLLSS